MLPRKCARPDELASLVDMLAAIRKSGDEGRVEPKSSAACREGLERFGGLRHRGSK